MVSEDTTYEKSNQDIGIVKKQNPQQNQVHDENNNLPSIHEVCSIETALDNLDLFLHKAFSRALLGYQRNLFWKTLEKKAAGDSTMLDLERISVEELYQLSFRCNLADIDPVVSEIKLCKELLSFLKIVYSSLVLQGEEDPESDLIVLPNPALKFGFVIHIGYLSRNSSKQSEFTLCFPSQSISKQISTDGQLFLTSFVQTLFTWLWSEIDLEPL